MDSRVRRAGFASQYCHFLAMSLWSGYYTFLSLTFFICKVGITTVSNSVGLLWKQNEKSHVEHAEWHLAHSVK